jgi:hypothetical protein
LADAGGLGLAGTAAGTRYGGEGFLRAAEEAVEAFEEYSVEPEDFIDAGEAVVVPVRISGRGRVSGARLETRLAHLCFLRRGSGALAVVAEDWLTVRGASFRTAARYRAAPMIAAVTARAFEVAAELAPAGVDVRRLPDGRDAGASTNSISPASSSQFCARAKRRSVWRSVSVRVSQPSVERAPRRGRDWDMLIYSLTR